MTGLLLVGASGLARETAEAVRAAGEGGRLLGYLDDDPATWGTSVGGLPVLGGLERVREHPDAQLLLCTGPGRTRSLLAGRLEGLGVAESRYATVVDPSVRVPSSCRVGAGSILLRGVVLTADVTVGRHVVVMPNVVLTHDDVLDDFVTVTAGVCLASGVRVGSGAYLGTGSLVRGQCHVGAGATVGMGAVVIRDVPDDEVWVGNPARRLRAAVGASVP